MKNLMLVTYKNNRVFGLILKELNTYETFVIKENKRIKRTEQNKDLKIYDISLRASLSHVESYDFKPELKHVIEKICEVYFKENYSFDFSNTTKLGYTASFSIVDPENYMFGDINISHRIKEVKK